MDDDGDRGYQYRFGKSTAGFIYYDRGGEQRFFRSWDVVVKEHLDFFPRNRTICNSNMGLLLCYRPHNAVPVRCIRLCRGKCRLRHRAFDPSDSLRQYAYSVCNPIIPGSTRNIPNPPNWPHPDHIPRVLVIYKDPVRPRFVFHIVCALVSHVPHSYTFDVYSSAADVWTTSGPHHVLGRIRKKTGVSDITGRAYWLLKNRPLIVYYDVTKHSVGSINLPDSYASMFGQPDVGLRSQLGRCENAIHLVATNQHRRVLYRYYNGLWYLEEEKTDAYPRLPMLSRFEDGRVHVPFWFDNGEVVIWDSSWDGNGAERIVRLDGPQRELNTNVLPLVTTLLHPSDHFDDTPHALFDRYFNAGFLG